MNSINISGIVRTIVTDKDFILEDEQRNIVHCEFVELPQLGSYCVISGTLQSYSKRIYGNQLIFHKIVVNQCNS